MSYAAKGAYPDAIREYETAARILQMSPPLIQGLLANAYGRSGDAGEAAAHLRALEAMSAHHYVPAEYLLLAHIGVGDRDAAFHDIEQAQANRSAGVIYLAIEPIVDPIRSDPRFKTLLAKLPQ
jgi:tetratricopeptide (TPR) repeat protein